MELRKGEFEYFSTYSSIFLPLIGKYSVIASFTSISNEELGLTTDFLF